MGTYCILPSREAVDATNTIRYTSTTAGGSGQECRMGHRVHRYITYLLGCMSKRQSSLMYIVALYSHQQIILFWSDPAKNLGSTPSFLGSTLIVLSSPFCPFVSIAFFDRRNCGGLRWGVATLRLLRFGKIWAARGTAIYIEFLRACNSFPSSKKHAEL